jgi:hypothetical protein
MVGEGKDLFLQLLRGLVLGGAVKNRSSMVLDGADGSERTWMRVAEVEIGSVGVFLAAAAIWIDGGGADVDYRWLGRVEVELDRDWDVFFFVAGRVSR